MKQDGRLINIPGLEMGEMVEWRDTVIALAGLLDVLYLGYTQEGTFRPGAMRYIVMALERLAAELEQVTGDADHRSLPF